MAVFHFRYVHRLELHCRLVQGTCHGPLWGPFSMPGPMSYTPLPTILVVCDMTLNKSLLSL